MIAIMQKMHELGLDLREADGSIKRNRREMEKLRLCHVPAWLSSTDVPGGRGWEECTLPYIASDSQKNKPNTCS
jgi:hypothetical protein